MKKIIRSDGVVSRREGTVALYLVRTVISTLVCVDKKRLEFKTAEGNRSEVSRCGPDSPRCWSLHVSLGGERDLWKGNDLV